MVAATADGMDSLENEVGVKAGGQTIVRLALQPVRDARLRTVQQAREQEARDEAAGVWTDPATRLVWTERDNGSDLNWEEAIDYCRNLQLAGHSDWSLPAIDQLQSIYDSSLNVSGRCCGGSHVTWHVKGNLQLSGVHWSISQGNVSGAAWFFAFDNGRKTSLRVGDRNMNRALWVRRSGE